MVLNHGHVARSEDHAFVGELAVCGIFRPKLKQFADPKTMAPPKMLVSNFSMTIWEDGN